MMERKDIVYPGDSLGTTEEYVSGPGTVVEKDMVIATVFGKAEYDEKEKQVSVKPFTISPVELKKDDLVIGEVIDVKESSVSVSISMRVPDKRPPATGDRGIIHISKASNEYVSDLKDAFRIGDILRAKVIEGPPVLELSTEGPHLGVMRAFCTLCRGPLELISREYSEEGGLECPICHHREHRKISNDYGLGMLVPEVIEKEDSKTEKGRQRGGRGNARGYSRSRGSHESGEGRGRRGDGSKGGGRRTSNRYGGRSGGGREGGRHGGSKKSSSRGGRGRYDRGGRSGGDR